MLIALFRERSRPRGLPLPFLIAFFGAGLAGIPAVAQLNELATAAPGLKTSNPAPAATPISNQRDAEYAALARDVDSLGREFGLVKRVVKLVTPSVVHIESKPLPKYQGVF